MTRWQEFSSAPGVCVTHKILHCRRLWNYALIAKTRLHLGRKLKALQKLIIILWEWNRPQGTYCTVPGHLVQPDIWSGHLIRKRTFDPDIWNRTFDPIDIWSEHFIYWLCMYSICIYIKYVHSLFNFFLEKNRKTPYSMKMEFSLKTTTWGKDLLLFKGNELILKRANCKSYIFHCIFGSGSKSIVCNAEQKWNWIWRSQRSCLLTTITTSWSQPFGMNLWPDQYVEEDPKIVP